MLQLVRREEEEGKAKEPRKKRRRVRKFHERARREEELNGVDPIPEFERSIDYVLAARREIR